MTSTLPFPSDVTVLTDDDLMELLRGGERGDPLAELERRYGYRLYQLVQGIVRDRDLADDVCQEVLQKLFTKCHLYRPQASFSAWLFEVARNQALSALRARRTIPRPISDLTTPDEEEEGELLHVGDTGYTERLPEERELMEAFERAVETLPQRYREVFELCVRQGLQYQAASERLGIPTGTVAIRIMRARKRLFDTLSCHLDRIRRPPACFVN